MPFYHEVVSAAGETATKILAQRTKVRRRVVVTCDGGKTASVVWSDLKPDVTLNLPTLPPDSVMTRAEADRMVGYIAHECCHVIHTDWRAWTHACAMGDAVRELTNCLEDVRIEAAEIRAKAFPALRTLLSSLVTQTHADALARATSEGVMIGSRVAHFPYVITILGRLRNGYSVPTAHTLARDLCPPVRGLVDQALAELRTCRNTDQTRELARRLLAMAETMAKAAEPPPPPPAQEGPGEGQDAPGEGKGQDEGQDAPGEGQDAPGEGKGQNEGQDGQDGPGEGQDGPGEGQGAPGEGKGQDEGQDGQDAPGEGKGQDEGQDGPDAPGESQGAGNPFDTADAINPDDLSKLAEKIAERYGEKGMKAFGESNAHLLPMTENRTERQPNRRGAHNTAMADAMQELTGRTSVLHGQLARLLVSEEKRRATHHETSGRLDRRALTRMRTGALDVFSQREESPAIETAVLILVDQSVSMGDIAGKHPVTQKYINRSMMAVATAWALARAAEDAGAKVAVAGFRSDDRLSRYAGAILTLAKDFDEPCVTAAYTIARLNPLESTPLAPAILEAARVLASVNATRWICICLTDGECNFGGAAVTGACNIAAGMGVETVGVGMACASVVKAFPDHHSVNVVDMAQLATTGLGALVRMLEEAEEGRR